MKVFQYEHQRQPLRSAPPKRRPSLAASARASLPILPDSTTRDLKRSPEKAFAAATSAREPAHIDNLLLLSTQPPNRFQNRQVCLTGPVLFQTLSSTYPNAAIRSDASRERVDQRGLADARFACNKYDLTFSSQASSRSQLRIRDKASARPTTC